ncbi:unnamed protein product [Clonostachys rosea]|uniref:Uncharacterized protein n=1 Tax=Bionectria ochroleuca TaxID=29856 RepID=A0ABY6TQZ1_BIOOC|nr:unnamed protein product [Clonostachys rosea]
MGLSSSRDTAKPAAAPASEPVIVHKPATTSHHVAAETPQQQQTAPAYPPVLKGKVYAITGGASGIGYGTAQMLSSRGATVCIADIDPKAMGEAEDYFTRRDVPFMISRVDVSKRAQVDAWIDSVIREYGRLDGAANVAGVIGKVHGLTAVEDMEDDEWDKIIAVNLTGTMYCMRAEIRNLVKGGSIVNVSSIHGVRGFARHSAYDASKHGIIGLTKAAAQEVGDRGIRVNAVGPGSIYTPLMQKEWDEKGLKEGPAATSSAIRRYGTVEETASVLAFLLGPESSFISGSTYMVDGAWS